jgi:hypothetical protein
MTEASDLALATALLEEIKGIEIDDLDTFTKLAHGLLFVKAKVSLLEEMRLEETRPLRQELDAVNAKFSAGKVYAEVEDTLKRKIGEFVDRRTAESILSAQKALQDGDKLGLYVHMRPIPNVPGLEYRTVSEVEVVDEGAIPETYFKRTLDKAAVLKSLKGARASVAGVKLCEKTQVAVCLKDSGGDK